MATFSVDGWALKKIELDTANQTIPDVLIANEGDANGRGIDLQITQDGAAASMTGMSVYLAWGHECGAEGLTKFTATDASRGRFKVYYPAQMQRRGTVVARVMVYAGSKTPITGSRDFRIFVERNPINEDAAITTDDFSVFKAAVIDLNEAKKAADAATKKATDAATAAGTAAGNASKAAESANASAGNADKATKTANDAAGEATKAAKSAADAAKNAAAETEKATAATSDAAAAAKSATSATSQAQGAAQNAIAAGSQAMAIANSIAAGAAGDDVVEAMKGEIDTLGYQLAEATGKFMLVGTTVYAPSSKASISGSTVSLPTSSVSGTTINLA